MRVYGKINCTCTIYWITRLSTNCKNNFYKSFCLFDKLFQKCTHNSSFHLSKTQFTKWEFYFITENVNFLSIVLAFIFFGILTNFFCISIFKFITEFNGNKQLLTNLMYSLAE